MQPDKITFVFWNVFNVFWKNIDMAQLNKSYISTASNFNLKVFNEKMWIIARENESNSPNILFAIIYVYKKSDIFLYQCDVLM